MNQLTNYKTEKIFNRLLTNKSKKNYWNYVRELRKRRTKQIFKRSVLLTSSSSLDEKILGVNILAQFGFPRLHKKQIINIFFNLLNIESDKKILSAILYGIGHNNDKLTLKQLEILSSFKKHKSSLVRQALAFSLCAVEKELAINILIELSKDKDADVRDWSVFALGSQIEIDNSKIRKALFKRLDDKSGKVRFEAISGLAQRKDERIKEILKNELKNLDENGSLILESIEQFGDISFLANLQEKLIENKKTKKVNEDWIINTINNLKAMRP